ncbi:hypothetical protein HH308_07475 [Gordonia sp. TBRC 11910]|uniref:Uncharacterized protein n=1 Tax=Gordonia asplenii TaxID=2725283 RepID=A0A848KPV8_9ACTN|nr:hypothetical protein [Gordonia asplenii]NMO01054.1 hypothetical protein [Gordonia asplenii]
MIETNRDGSVLFLSCDLQNSTQFKQSSAAAAHQEWVPTFLAFYNEFPAALGEIIADRFPYLTGQLTLWKAVGDELIFTCRLIAESQCCDAIDAWVAAMDRFESNVLQKTPMTLKGGAFLATVPFPDRQVAIPRRDVETGSELDAEKLNESILARDVDPADYLLDYVGPSIDTGFRILKFAAHRYFVMTVDVAHLVFAHSVASDIPRDAYFLGTHRLKGVWEGRPYPVFALARELGDIPSQALALALGASDLVDDEYPSCPATNAVDALVAYRHSPSWPGVVHLDAARDDEFAADPRVVAQRIHLNRLQDDSEKPLVTGDAGEGDIDRLPLT